MFKSTNLTVISFLLFFLFLNTSIATTYTVTVATDCGSGSIVDAVAKANANPGKDTIDFASGIKRITFPNCEGSASYDPSDSYYLWISESVDFIAPLDVDPTIPGNQKLTIDGEGAWIDMNGALNPGICPNHDGVNIKKPPGVFRIGSPYIDNSGISVLVKNLKATQVRSFAITFKGATLSLLDSNLEKIADNTSCINPLIRIREEGKLIIDNSYIGKNQYLQGARTWNYGGMLLEAGDNSITEISNSLFEINSGMGAIFTSGKLTIVNSLFNNSGGIMSLDGDVSLINSAFFSDTTHPWEGIYAIGGTFNIRASTFSARGWLTSTPPSIGTPPDIEKASLIRFPSNTVVNFEDTALHVLNVAGQYLPITYAGSTVQLSVTQSYSADGSLTGSISAPPLGIADAIPFIPIAITPLIGGPLVDKIDNSANPLINPLTGSAITTDVYGNPRVDSALRDIGAVELYDAPILSATGIDSAAILIWSKPDVAGTTISEYIINYRETGSSPWSVWTRHDTQLLEIVRNLTNGTSYDFRVAANTNLGQLPWSNIATATPMGPPILTTASISLSASTLHFGNLPVGNSRTQQLTISSLGSADLNIGSIVSDNTVFTVINDNCSHTIVPPGSSCSLDIKFLPAIQGAVNGHILIPSNAITALDKVGVSGIGDVASAFLSTAHLSFGNQIINTSSTTQTVTLTDNSSAALVVTSLTSKSAEFIISNDNCSGQTVSVGGQCTFDVHFTPAYLNGRSSTISLISSATSSPDNITVDGTGINNYGLTVNTGTLHFYNQIINTTSQPKQIILSNSGQSPLSFSGISVPSRFAITQDNCTGQTITSGNSCTILVTFTPNQIGLVSSTLQISSNHPNSPHNILLYGNGIIAQAIPVNSKTALFILFISMLLYSFYFMKKNNWQNQ